MKYKEIIFTSIAGFIIGLPQGLKDLDFPVLQSTKLPKDTILIIGIFGLISGLAFGMQFLSKASRNYSQGAYFFFLVGTLSIGIPTVIRNFDGNLLHSLNISGLFFTSIGFAMILGGLLSHALNKE